MTGNRADSRVSTGVDGLDAILRGGLIRGSIYMLQGTPGAGKTILSNQMCFMQAAQGGNVLFVTLLAENHARMIANLGGFAFFDAAAIPDRVTYLSLFGELRDGGLPALSALLRREIRKRSVGFLVIDGLIAARTSTTDEEVFKQFIHSLQEVALATDCTMLLVTTAEDRTSPEETMVDGLFELSDCLHGWESSRELRVKKFRGSSFLQGRHSLEISDEGIAVYPRLEALHAFPSRADAPSDAVIASGLRELDDMLGGGLPVASTTIVSGPSGTGKTTLGLHFLGACSPEEPGLLFGFYETPPRIALKAQRFGLPLAALLEAGTVEMIWNPSTGGILDAYGQRILEAVDRTGVKRLFIDGLSAFHGHTADPARVHPFFSVLASELRLRGVTTLYSLEARRILGSLERAPIHDVSNLAENMVLLGFDEVGSRLRRLVSVLKVRDGNADPGLREFWITDHGVRIDEPRDARLPRT